MGWIVITQYTFKNGKTQTGALSLLSEGKYGVKTRKQALAVATPTPSVMAPCYKKIESIVLSVDEAERLIGNMRRKIKLLKDPTKPSEATLRRRFIREKMRESDW